MAYPIDELPEEALEVPVGFKSCSLCGRTFNPDVLERHQRICQKSQISSQKRKKFDSSKQRQNQELKVFLATHGRAPTPKQVKKDWRKKHEVLVGSLRAARTVSEAIKTGAPLPPHQPSAPDPDYVQCPYCERRFQESAAERHIPFCKEQKSRIERKPSSKAQDKLSKRLLYKPPSVKKKSLTKLDSETGDPPGASLVVKNTNFSATYSLDQDPSLGKPLGRAARPGMNRRIPLAKQPADGNRSNNPSGLKYIPHPPDYPNSKSRIVRETSVSRRNTSTHPHHIPRHNSGASKQENSSESDEQEPLHLNNSRRLANGIEHSRLVSLDARNQSPPSGEEVRMNQLASLNQRLKAKSQRTDREPSSDSLHPSNKDLHYNISTMYKEDRASSGSSVGSRNSASHRRTPVNAHGMVMSKFCYECGFKFPVPQAKYCCECGTKRI